MAEIGATPPYVLFIVVSPVQQPALALVTGQELLVLLEFDTGVCIVPSFTSPLLSISSNDEFHGIRTNDL
jgi:hypothetical protein